MTKIIVIILCTAMAGAASAADVIELPATKGKVSFPHKKHQDMLQDCLKCHEKGPGKIPALGQAWAHKVCKGCHADMKKGPVSCKSCHQQVS
jgi:predicted CXXCH cytochrome family protein